MSAAPHVFVVEDEEDIASIVQDYLHASGFTSSHCGNGLEALQRLRAPLPVAPALVLLDVMLPGLSGIDVLRELRRGSQVPVIMLTARVEELDRLQALDLGADDYICKPFSPREVVARVKAVLRRFDAPGVARQARRLVLDGERFEAALDGQKLGLTRKEFLLLAALFDKPGRILSRAQLLAHAHADELDVTERAIDSHVKNLRRKLAAADSGGEWIRSVYGVGFSGEEPAS